MTTPLPRDTTQHVEPLRRLEAEARVRSITTVLVPDPAGAYLRLIRGTATETVWLDTRESRRCYRWGRPATTHPLFDPTGAARRLATLLHRERRDAEGTRRCG